MNKAGKSKILWLIILFVTFIIMNKVSIWVNGSTLPAINQWISIVGQSIIETVVSGIILYLWSSR